MNKEELREWFERRISEQSYFSYTNVDEFMELVDQYTKPLQERIKTINTTGIKQLVLITEYEKNINRLEEENKKLKERFEKKDKHGRTLEEGLQEVKDRIDYLFLKIDRTLDIPTSEGMSGQILQITYDIINNFKNNN